MNESTYRLIRLLQGLLLLVCVAGSIAAVYYLVTAVVLPPAGDVVVLQLRRPTPTAEAGSTALQNAIGQVAAGAPQQVLPASINQRLVYHEANPARRFVLHLISTQPQSVPYVLATLAFCVLLYLILRDIRPHTPFSPANVRRIRWLGLLLIGSDVYHWTASWWLRHHLAALLAADPSEIIPITQFGSSLIANWLLGLLLLIIAAGYRRGVELAEDAELTV